MSLSTFTSIQLPESFFLPFNAQVWSEWLGYRVRWIRDISNHSSGPFALKVALFSSANFVVFTYINRIASDLEREVNRTYCTTGDKTERKFNLFLIDGCFVGGTILVFNLLLSRLTAQSIHISVLGLLTGSAIALRSFFHLPFSPQEQRSSPAKKRENSIIYPAHINTTHSWLYLNFIVDFCKDIQVALTNSYKSIHFQEDKKQAQAIALEHLHSGMAVIKGDVDHCQAICMPIQVTFEKLLLTMLTTGNISDATAYFLADLPHSPFRNPLQIFDNSTELDWKKWCLVSSSKTLQGLREKGVQIHVCYSDIFYSYLQNSPRSEDKNEVETYEFKKKQNGVVDIPISGLIPSKLVGALYEMIDQDKNKYYFAIENYIQSGEIDSNESWKIWFGPASNSEIIARVHEVTTFIEEKRNNSFFSQEMNDEAAIDF